MRTVIRSVRAWWTHETRGWPDEIRAWGDKVRGWRDELRGWRDELRQWLSPPYWTGFQPIPVTLLLVLLNVCLHEFALLIGGEEGHASLELALEMDSERVLSGELWRLLTSGFVHRDWDHLRWNVTYMLPLGVILESQFGSRRLTLVYGLALLASSALDLLSHRPSLGASGAVHGLQGFLLAFPLRRTWQGHLRVSKLWFLNLALAAKELSLNPFQPDVAMTAHIAGLTTGLLCGTIVGARKFGASPREVRLRLAAACLAMTGFVAAIAPTHRVRLEAQMMLATGAEHLGHDEQAATWWRAVGASADSRSRTGAQALWQAAAFHLSRKDSLAARPLLAMAAPVLDQVYPYQWLGTVEAFCHPTDFQSAEKHLRRALALDPCDADALNDAAMLYLFSGEEHLEPVLARALARNAVREEGKPYLPYLATLAWADYRCGDESLGMAEMRRVIAMDPDSSSEWKSDLDSMMVAKRGSAVAGIVTPRTPNGR